MMRKGVVEKEIINTVAYTSRGGGDEVVWHFTVLTEVCLSGGKPAPIPNLTACFTEANFISVYMGL